MTDPTKRGLTAPKIPGLVQPPVDRPPQQLPQPVQCAVCSRVIAAAAATMSAFGGWVCRGSCKPGPDRAGAH